MFKSCYNFGGFTFFSIHSQIEQQLLPVSVFHCFSFLSCSFFPSVPLSSFYWLVTTCMFLLQLQDFEAALKQRDGIITQLTTNLQQAREEKDEIMKEFLELTEQSQKLQIQFQQVRTLILNGLLIVLLKVAVADWRTALFRYFNQKLIFSVVQNHSYRRVRRWETPATAAQQRIFFRLDSSSCSTNSS